MEMNYCRRCGHELIEKDVGFWQCDQNHSAFLNPAPAAGLFIVTDDQQIILGRRSIEPGLGLLVTPGGFVETNETSEAAMEREVLEETGLTPDQYEKPQIFCTATDEYRYEEEDKPVLTTFFWTRLIDGAVPKPREDISEIVTMPIKDLDFELLYGDDVKTALVELQKILKIT